MWSWWQILIYIELAVANWHLIRIIKRMDKQRSWLEPIAQA